MINKVIYIGYQPLTEKVKGDFYFKELNNNNILVEYWDLSPIYFNSINFQNQINDQSVIIIDSFKKLEEKLKIQEIDFTLFVTNITLEYRVLKLYRILSTYKCKTSFFARGALPNVKYNSILKFYLLKLKKVIKFNAVLNFLGNRYVFFLKKTKKIRPFFIIFRAGKFGLKTIGIGNEIEEQKSEIIDVNYFDYDKFLNSRNCSNLLDGKYCLYLDEYLPFHPDFQMFNIKTIDHKRFYEGLNNFFNLIEKKYNIEVVIAAHPKAEKYKNINFFDGRKIYFNKAAELTRYADFVIGHNSSSLSFGVLNFKPIILIYNDSIKKIMPSIYNSIFSFSETLGVNCIDFEEGVTNVIINTPDELKYLDFKYKYLTSKKSEFRLSSEIFIETILSI